MKKLVVPLLFLACAFAHAPASAHQPQLTGDRTAIAVDAPEISKAYYASLNGAPATYTIRSTKPFSLYVNILVPAIKGATLNYSARITKDGRPFAFLDGARYKWKRFYEEFGGDDYFMGPELRTDAAAGVYEITVSNPSLSGKYVVAIGEKESFTLPEIIRTLVVLPGVKMYFNKSPFTAYFNRIGLFMLPVVAVFVSIILIGVAVLRKKR